MNTFKRLVISIKGHIDQVAGQLENHEALAEAAIRELEAVQKHIRLQIHRLGQGCQRERETLERLEQEAGRWRERAIRVREQDEAKALECVRRLQSVQERIRQHRGLLERLEKQLSRTKSDLAQVEAKLGFMRNRKLVLAARQTHGQVCRLESLKEAAKELEAVFEHWEESLAASGCLDDFDTEPETDLEAEFRQKEEIAELRAMLDELAKGKES